ncbi:hypothetical protein HOV49_gp56 [Staphylococcus phage vB_SpsS_QT1]|uniref:Uncharacterized protein n=1 Tax=Staphylococcus phage vB_SpsS_QT1 TaxID=2510452 RepID=A0A4P6R1P4_9CAUD|nr:hypothetical protein HOV49_gp56 [Staphylococcus phage vB_SpsS_QT1]QBJ05167.1 hypothetical protein [Staphylococcus phage vB_SpsS_QT1]
MPFEKTIKARLKARHKCSHIKGLSAIVPCVPFILLNRLIFNDRE